MEPVSKAKKVVNNLKQKARYILFRYPYKNWGRPISKEHEKWLIENVFVTHPNWNVLRIGFKHVTVKDNDNFWDSRGFYIISKYPGFIDMKQCLKTVKQKEEKDIKEHIQEYKSAMRNEIAEQRNDFFTLKKGKEKIHEVDHVIPFLTLLIRFEKYCIQQNTINISELRAVEKVGSGFILKNRNYASIWKNWHKNNAVLQLLTVEAHKMKTKRDKKLQAEEREREKQKMFLYSIGSIED